MQRPLLQRIQKVRFARLAVAFAIWMGVSELVIGLTIVAAGTSLPEVATSILAALRGERDIAVGNVVGSNIFNLLGVLGISALVAPTALPVSAGMFELRSADHDCRGGRLPADLFHRVGHTKHPCIASGQQSVRL